MQPDFIARIVALLRNPEDRIILVDSATGKAVVLMDLARYEALSGTTSPVTASEPIVQASQPQPVLEEPEAPRLEPRVEAPIPAPALPKKQEGENIQKKATISDNPFKKRAKQLGVEEPAKGEGLGDLTQAELLDKINRDIGEWKTAQERKRSDELQSVARSAPTSKPHDAREEEERFYLEPIE